MIITKKKFEEAIKKARAEENEKYAVDERKEAERREISERFLYYDRRMDKAFSDINRRLTELEKSRPEPHNLSSAPY